MHVYVKTYEHVAASVFLGHCPPYTLRQGLSLEPKSGCQANLLVYLILLPWGFPVSASILLGGPLHLEGS